MSRRPPPSLSLGLGQIGVTITHFFQAGEEICCAFSQSVQCTSLVGREVDKMTGASPTVTTDNPFSMFSSCSSSFQSQKVTHVFQVVFGEEFQQREEEGMI